MDCPTCETKDWDVSKECTVCGHPDVIKTMKHFEDNAQMLDTRYRWMRYLHKKGWIEFKGHYGTHGEYIHLGNILGTWLGWMMSDGLGPMIYIVWNVLDANNFQLRGTYTSPHLAREAVKELEQENKDEGISATPHWEGRPLNHPFGSCMFSKKSKLADFR